MRPWLAAVPLVVVLYFFGFSAAGMIGPDEPRYASIGREMARSGDWVTPRLWGEPWFEKPALLYWMTAAGFRAGLTDDLAPRMPVALPAVAFLMFYQRTLARHFAARAAWFATAILGASGIWLAYGRIGVTDLPMAAGVLGGHARPRLGATATAGGCPRRARCWGWPCWPRDWCRWSSRRRWPGAAAAVSPTSSTRASGCLVAVAGPWYLLCWRRNGDVFLDTFFWQHQVGRFANGALQHEQPFWFYLPVLAGALLPWTPLVLLLFRRGAAGDPRRAFLLCGPLFGSSFSPPRPTSCPGTCCRSCRLWPR